MLLDEFARAQGMSLADTVAYADSTSDLPMLEAAGFPVVINPEAKLAAIARRRGWFIEHWETSRRRPEADSCDREHAVRACRRYRPAGSPDYTTGEPR